VIVVDASVLADILLDVPDAVDLEARIFDSSGEFHAPHLIDLKVAHVIRRRAARGEISGERGRGGLADLRDLPLRRWPHDFLLHRIWALRHNLSAYDAAYVALAEELDAPLLTRDRRLANASGHRARIELV
jgi:predicted nucleic acid-binding protein